MARIENTTVYPIKAIPSVNDYFIITDVADNNATKNCKISSVSSSINIFEVEVTVPTPNMQNIATSMFTLIPAVSGKYIVPMSIVAKLDFGTAAYNFGGSDNIWITTASAGGNGYASILGSFLNSPTDNTTAGTGSGMANGGFLPNENLVLWGAGAFANPTLGDGTLKINIQYRLVSTL